MHANRGLVTILFSHEVLSSSPYPVITHAPLVAGNLPIKKTLVARQCPTNTSVHTYMCNGVHSPTSNRTIRVDLDRGANIKTSNSSVWTTSNSSPNNKQRLRFHKHVLQK